jgi:tRNA threonylcarbamoyladenosine biosynthesis protein TsaB
MSAKALAYATGCALLAVDTFAAIAAQAPAEAHTLHVLADAQQDRVYVQYFQRERPEEEFVPASPLVIESVKDWLFGVAERAWVSGPGLRKHEAGLPASLHFVGTEHRDPRPESLLRIGLARYLRGERDDLWTVEPLYLRPSSAEEQWQARVVGPSEIAARVPPPAP